MKLYWFRFDAPGLPVEFPALRTRWFRWRGIHGVQIGSWFFGAVKGSPSDPWPTPLTATTDEGRPA